MSRPCNGDWMRLRCGDTVRLKDGRHFGRVEKIENAHWVTIKWLGTGWLSNDITLDEIEPNRKAE